MVYFTGDIHGAIDSIDQFNRKVHPTKDDVIVLLGDVGANYYRGRRDERLKEYLNQIGPVFLCIHGNHEIRPTNIPGYTELQWNGGVVWAQPEYPNLLFARDGEIFELNGLRYRHLRLERHQDGDRHAHRSRPGQDPLRTQCGQRLFLWAEAPASAHQAAALPGIWHSIHLAAQRPAPVHRLV